MLYDMHCSHCNTTTERECRVAERDNQACDKCSTTLENVTKPTARILIPVRFHTNSEDCYINPTPAE